MAKQHMLENTIPQEELDMIITSYKNNNVSLRKLSEQTGHSRAAITRMLERLGVKTESGNHYRYNFFDFDYFEKIDTERKAYWLGFLYADGCIQTPKYGEQSVKLALAKQDEDVLVKFKEDLQSTYPIRYDESRHLKNENHQIQVIQELRSQKTVDDLKRLGCIERKSLILKFPTEEQVPLDLIWHFIRGYFDGDGSISHYENDYNINFVGTEDFINGLYKIVQMGSVFKDKRKENSWYLNINGNKQILTMYDKMYGEATRYMDRKYNKFQPLIKKYRETEGI